MRELTLFGATVLVAAVRLAAARLSSRLSSRLRVPGPASFLVAAALAAWIWPGLKVLSVR